MLKMTRRIGRLSGLIAAGVAIVGTGSGVMAASYSAFSGTTNSAANQWNTGSVVLGNDAASGAMFTGVGAANQQMNATGTKCIKVTSTGTLPTTVKLYSAGFVDASTPTSLGSHIHLTINIGSASGGGTFADCTGFTSSSNLFTGTLASFYSTYGTSYTGGLSTGWSAVANSDYRVFQFIWSYDSTAPQSATASDTFTWEAQGS